MAARTKNRFMRDEEENELEPGEVLTAPQATEPKGEEETKPVSEPPKEPEQPQPSEEKKSEPDQADPAPVKDILADLIPKKSKPKPETFGFYLDGDVHDELVRLAKANKTNKSKFLNALLRRVLFHE